MNIHNNDATQVALEIIERIQVVTGVVQLAPAPGGVPFLHELPEGCDRILVCGHVFMRAA
jgi:hypothetical protein